MTTVLVLAATGKTGRNLVPALLSRRVEVRAATRNPAGFDGAAEATPVRFEWNEPQTWDAALAGVDSVYLVKPEIENAADRVAEFLAAMTKAGVSRLVLHSEVAGETRADSDEERRIELAVEQSDLDWTIVRPNWFVQDLADDHFFGGMIRDDGIIAMTTGGSGIAWIDNRDIAATAAELLVNPGLRRHEALTLTGPEAITLDALTARITAITGHQVAAVEEPIEEAEERMKRDNVPEHFAAYLNRVNVSIVAGDVAEVTDSVEQVTGRRPLSIDTYLAEWAPQLEAYSAKKSRDLVAANEKLFVDVIAAFEQQDIDQLLEYYNDDMVYIDMPYPEAASHGIDAFRTYLGGYFSMFDKVGFTAEIVTLVANETHAVGELFCTANYIGEGAPDGGIAVTWNATLVQAVVDGKISEERAYFDPTDIAKALAKASA